MIAATVVVEAVDSAANEWSEMLDSFKKWLPEGALFVIHLVLAVILFLLGRKLIRWIVKKAGSAMEKKGMDRGMQMFLIGLMRILLYAAMIFGLLQLVGYPAASLLTILGSVGLAVGLALQGSLSNFAGGVLIIVTKPFRVGDFISESTHGHEGYVEEIGLFYTKLRARNQELAVVPNGTLVNSALVNKAPGGVIRLDIPVQIAYEADVEKARDIIRKILADHPGVMKDRMQDVFVDSFAPDGVDLLAICFVSNPEYDMTRRSLNEKIKKGLEDGDVRIPFRQVDVHLVSAPEEDKGE